MKNGVDQRVNIWGIFGYLDMIILALNILITSLSFSFLIMTLILFLESFSTAHSNKGQEPNHRLKSGHYCLYYRF
jgi:hypothetical protein